MAVLTAAVLVLSGCSQVSQNNAAAETQQSMEIEVSAETSAAEPTAESESAEASAGESYDRSTEYEAAVLEDGDVLTGGTYVATGEDESVLEASGSVQAVVTGALLQKVSGGASSADGSSFYGLNAGIRVYGDAVLTLTDCDIEASADNATGVFSYENGTIYLESCTVDVTGGGAGGVQVAGGGTLYGTNLTVSTTSKAPIRSDRGGGTMVIDGGTYTTTGTNGCPAIYSTADITVSNADLVSENSRAVIIEGKNSVQLINCTLTGNDQSTKEGSIRANVLLYQSMSGDAGVGTSVFTMNGGSMTCQSGAMFYCTNTASVIELSDAELILSEDGTLLIVSAGRWGKDGSNGGDCTLNASAQTLEGDIYVDEISSLQMKLASSSYTGSITGEGTVDLVLDADSTWTLTGDSYISSFDGDLSSINLNGFTLYIDGEAIS